MPNEITSEGTPPQPPVGEPQQPKPRTRRVYPREDNLNKMGMWPAGRAVNEPNPNGHAFNEKLCNKLTHPITIAETAKIQRQDPEWVRRQAVLALTDVKTRELIQKELPPQLQIAIAKQIITLSQPTAAMKIVELVDSKNEATALKAAQDILDRGPILRGMAQPNYQPPIIINNFDPSQLWGMVKPLTPEKPGVTIDAEVVKSELPED